jgi:hypothetical protein
VLSRDRFAVVQKRACTVISGLLRPSAITSRK